MRADSACRTLEDTFGGCLAYSAEHSHSGYNAARFHLLPYRTPARPTLYGRLLGPLHRQVPVIDAVIDLAWTRKRYPEASDAFFIKPAAIADEIWHVIHQDKSAWSFNVEIRPFAEKW